ncbi:MAG TPA: glycoside hydrolase family 57 protein [Bacteroidaceae bacterium]|nr:glycoside hydrolase family 57 protein [Bacteroidaceae bacterium]
MKTICLYFEIHQAMHLKRYRFFDIGTDHYYYDNYANDVAVTDVVNRSYVPALQTLLNMVQTYGGGFKVAFSISGVAISQLEIYAPEVIDLLQELAATGHVEFLAEPFSHGLSSLTNEEFFKQEVTRQQELMERIFGQKPKVLRNSSLLYSDEIGLLAYDMGFKGMVTEGAKQILGWKSPHYLYSCALQPKLNLLMRDYKLSDDICLRFNDSSWPEYPLTASKYADWIAQIPEDEEVINIFMELQSIGYYQPLGSGILDFLRELPARCSERGIRFATPSEILKNYKTVAPMPMPHPVTWNDEERDTSSWLGNQLQREAFNKLYIAADRVRLCKDRRIKEDFDYLQGSINFRYMNTKATAVGFDRGIYESAYDAFTNYMNILADFMKRVDALFPEDVDAEELNSLIMTIRNQDEEINNLNAQLQTLRDAAAQAGEAANIPVSDEKIKKTVRKTTSRKPASSKAKDSTKKV